MISFIYKNLMPFAVVLICFVACSKENADPASLLMKKAWTPYQVEIVTIDSNRITVTDTVTGAQKVTNSVLKKDTIYIVSTCQQNSLYLFKTNGVQTITDACST